MAIVKKTDGAVAEFMQQMIELKQNRALENQAAIAQVSQAKQRVIEALRMQIEALKQQNSALQEKLQVSERLQQPLRDEDARCVMMHQQRMTFLQMDLKNSQQEIETYREILKTMLESAKVELATIEQGLANFRAIPEGVVTQKWLAAHKDWSL